MLLFIIFFSQLTESHVNALQLYDPCTCKKESTHFIHFMSPCPSCHKLKQPALVDLLLSLPQHIPPGYLLPKWPLYFSTFNLYLMHPASTVRQVTSVAFKYLGK